jgi:hypothetical protein
MYMLNHPCLICLPDNINKHFYIVCNLPDVEEMLRNKTGGLIIPDWFLRLLFFAATHSAHLLFLLVVQPGFSFHLYHLQGYTIAVQEHFPIQ